MFAEQGDNRNRIKDICFYALFTAVCIVFGYIETLIPTSLIAPGIKLGLANSVSLLLILNGKIRGAVLVNFSRIILSAFLFGSPFSLLFSFVAGAVSIVLCAFLKKLNVCSAVGISVAGAVTHNSVQIIIATLVLNKGVLFYFPVLILSGIISGAVIGVIALIISKKIKTNGNF